jgi:hypothetical protein
MTAMTRKEYMEELEKELEGFDEASRRDILLEIEDHIDELAEKHGDMGEEELVAGLERPKKLADALRQEAGIGTGGRNPSVEPPPGGRQSEAGDGPRKAKPRITIDGEDLEEVIRRALDVASLFKGSRVFEEKFRPEDRDPGDPAKRVVMKDLPADQLENIIVTTKSTDVRVYLSTGGFSVSAEGGDEAKLTVRNDDGKTLLVSTAGRDGDMDSIELWVPAGVDRLSVKTISGDVEIADRVGDLDIETTSGDIAVRACSGSVRARSASGDLSIAACAEGLNLQTTSGDAIVELDEACDATRIETVSGDLELRYPEGLDATLRWATVSGDLDCDCDGQGARTIVLGLGTTPISLRTVSGDIRIKRL